MRLPGYLDNEWVADLDATNLQPGASFELCIDIDGSTSPGPVGGSNFEVYVSPVTALDSHTLQQLPNEKLTVACDECTVDTALYLGATCTQSSIIASMSATTTEGLWEATFDASGLTIGSNYKLCSDLDGSGLFRPLGNTGLSIYVSPVAGVGSLTTLTASVADASVALRITCSSSCGNDAEAFLGQECFDVRDLDPDAAPPSARFSTWASLVEVPGFLTERSLYLAQYLCCSMGVPQRSKFKNASFAPTSLSAVLLPAFTGWFASLDISMLRPGQVYRLCVDGDGPGPLREGDAGWEIYASPIQLLTTAVPGGSGRRALQMICAGCSSLGS
eukprot:g10367.t1